MLDLQVDGDDSEWGLSGICSDLVGDMSEFSERARSG